MKLQKLLMLLGQNIIKKATILLEKAKKDGGDKVFEDKINFFT